MTASPTYSGPTPIVRPIQFVTDVAAWRAFYEDVGLVGTGVDADGWTVLAADSGRLALHHAAADDPLAGKAKLSLEVPDLEEYRKAVAATGLELRPVTLGHGEALAVDLPHGRLHIDSAGPGEGGRAPVSTDGINLQPLVYGPVETVRAGADVAAMLGLTPRVFSDRGTWADLAAHGLIAFHDGPMSTVDGEVGCEVGLETGNVEAVQSRLEAAGRTSRIIDEAYGRTLRVDTPGGFELWVNEWQDDLYGYHLAQA
ncbi:VOC family protein [Georgenia alba]|uniref:VOC family protein n=1 Tax=Georgenia alba TaxID=2233858 RepID=A0ABW2Q4X8_9MICO